MEAAFVSFVGGVALGVQVLAALFIAVGAIEATIIAARAIPLSQQALGARREAWRGFAMWLVLALEFELGADVLRTLIAPSWTEIGQLAAIATIRTGLNYFLTRDLQAAPPS